MRRRDAPNVCCLGVMGIDGSVFERYSSGLFLSRFSFNLDFSLFARSSIQVIFFTMIFFSLSLYLTERLESSALFKHDCCFLLILSWTQPSQARLL